MNYGHEDDLTSTADYVTALADQFLDEADAQLGDDDIDADIDNDLDSTIEDIIAVDLDDDIESVVVDDGRSVDDFDFAAIVAAHPSVRVRDCLEAIEAEKGPFVAAWKREGRKGSAVSAFYSEANDPIFRKSRALNDTIERLKSKRRPTANDKAELSQTSGELEYVKELLFKLNYGLTRSYVSKFTSNTSVEDSLDFQAAANVGLWGAIRSFDPDKGKFGSWSYKPIQRMVLRAVQQADYANMTGGDFERRPAILRAEAELAGDDRETPVTDEEIAAHTGLTVGMVQRVRSAPHIDSLHTKVGADENTELGELIPDDARSVEDSVISDIEVHTLKNYGLPVLDKREQYVLICRYGLHGAEPEPLSDIGKRLGLSREAVRQIAGKALARLGHPMVLGALMRGGKA